MVYLGGGGKTKKREEERRRGRRGGEIRERREEEVGKVERINGKKECRDGGGIKEGEKGKKVCIRRFGARVVESDHMQNHVHSQSVY